MRDVYAATFFLGSPGERDADAARIAARATLAWAVQKYDSPEPADMSSGELVHEAGQLRWRTEEAPGDGRRLWQLDWRQSAPDDPGLLWQTRCQIAGGDGATRYTIRIAVDSRDLRLAPVRFDVGRPGVIARLAADPGIHMDDRPLRPAPAHVGSDQVPSLVDLLVSPDRRLPVIVITPSDATGRSLVSSGQMADRLIGLAHVVEIVARPVTYLLTERLGAMLSVFGGAIRTYWPGFRADSVPFDHPLWLPARIDAMEASPRGVVARLEQQLAGLAVIRVGSDPLEGELTAIRDATVLARTTDLQREIERLMAAPRDPGSEWLDELQRAYDEARGLSDAVGRLQAENADLRNEVEQLRRSFAAYSQSLEPASDEPSSSSMPEEIESCSQAFAAAQRLLVHLAVPDSAAVSLGELDSARTGRAWGRTAWRAFRALDAYAAEAGEYAGFRDWCLHSGSALAWSASEKKLAMRESETVGHSREFLDKRRFQVDRSLAPSGTLVMEAHIKVSEGGGQQAPRIYFHDDTSGTTRKVHIGFFGPHRYVPNTSTN